MLKFLLSLACAGALAAESTLTYQASAQGDGEWSAVMSIPKFNPNLGRLKSATLSYRLEHGASLALNNNEPFEWSVPVDSAVHVQLTSPVTTPLSFSALWTFRAPLETYGGFETNRVTVSVWSEYIGGCTGFGALQFSAVGGEDFNYSLPWNCDVSYCSWSAWRLTMVYRYEAH